MTSTSERPLVEAELTPQAIADLDYLGWLQIDCFYTDIKVLPGRRWAALFQLMFTHALILGRLGEYGGYDDRWCFHTEAAARTALQGWNGEPGTEPEGWHRHPPTGRRRGTEGEEWIAP